MIITVFAGDRKTDGNAVEKWWFIGTLGPQIVVNEEDEFVSSRDNPVAA